MGSVGKESNIVNSYLGAPGKDIFERFDNNISKDLLHYVNPHYNDQSIPYKERRQLYGKNCALCSVAGVLQIMGYDVEAMPRDKTWRGFNDVFEFDFKNYDNYLAPGNRNYQWSGTDYYTASNSTNTFSSRETANSATTKIEKQMEKWGLHSTAIMNVKWKDSNTAHAVVVYQEKYRTTIFDFQTGETFSGHDQIVNFMKDTTASRTGLYRLDNAKIKSDTPDIDKIVKKKGGK